MPFQHADSRQQPRESSTTILPDSRTLGYAVYGIPYRQKPECSTTTQTGLSSGQSEIAPCDDVPTVIYCHGVPGCRLEAAPLHKHAFNAGVRITSIDRPGIGLSSPLSKRTILDFADDVHYLLSHLGVKQYYILAYSAGAPYAYTLGLSASHRAANEGKESEVLGIGIVAGSAPWYIAVKTLTLSQRILSNLACWFPNLISYILEHNIARPARQEPSQTLIDIEDGSTTEMNIFEKIIEDQIDSLDSYSQTILENPENRTAFIMNMREAHKGLMKDLVVDIKLIISKWGFRLSDIRAICQTGTGSSPFIKMWYGGRDENVPLQQGEAMKKEIEIGVNGQERVELNVFPADTHFSMLPERGEHILRSLTGRSRHSSSSIFLA